MKTILCRADGNASNGLGHLYRMFALYEIYKADYDVRFVTREDSSLAVIPEGYNLITIPETVALNQEAQWLALQFDSKSTIIIADGYHFVGDYQKQLKQEDFYLVYIDDLVTEKIHADIVVNHSQKLQRHLFNTRKDTVFALGTKYAILRPLFLEAAKETRSVEIIDTAFVCFGGADALDLTSKAVEALLQCNPIKKIHVVLGGAYKHDTIFKITKNHPRISIHKNLNESELIRIMQECNFAIVPSSTILYEICCVNMPVLSGYFVDNQKNIYQAFDEDKVIYPGGDFSKYSAEDFRTAIKDILKMSNYQYFIENQSKLFDGKIKERFLNLLLPIEFRAATLKDSKLIFNWSNEALVRQNSFNSEALVFENHDEWYREKLQEASQIFLIVMVDQTEAALVRYTIQDDHAVVGISISKAFRGKQLASRILIDSAKEYFKTNTLPIFAFIKKNNIASIRSFENAGYTFLKATKVKDHDSVVYQLEKE